MYKNKEGTAVPQVVFKIREQGKWQDCTTDSVFKDKKVVFFALPGAFTPTCSSTHLPRYDELAPLFKKNGVDSIVCLSVNDAFVMNAWAKDLEVKNVTLLPDGNCEFTEKLGMISDKAAVGFGKRSWRYSMLVENGVITKMFSEAVKDGDPFEVSDAETMLKHIAPNETIPAKKDTACNL
jgi:peroxiredoxin